MNVYKITPRGYCKGVVQAINQVKQARKQYPDQKIYILGMLVHNEMIAKAFEEMGIITLHQPGATRLELLDLVHEGVVVLTAHGSAKEVKEKAINKGLIVVDATCVDVLNTYELIQDYLTKDYDVLYIGKKDHPEAEGAIAINPSQVHLIEKNEDIDQLDLNKKYLLTNQTTMSMWDVYALSEYAKTRLNHVEFMKEICHATQIRQEAVADLPDEVDLVLVVGDAHSNNSNKLVSIAQSKSGKEAYRINCEEDIDLNWLKGKQCIGITAGASTPTYLINRVIQFVEQLDLNDPTTFKLVDSFDLNKVI